MGIVRPQLTPLETELLQALTELLDFLATEPGDYSAPHEYEAVRESALHRAYEAQKKARGEA